MIPLVWCVCVCVREAGWGEGRGGPALESPTLGDGDGLEGLQLVEQTPPLGRLEAVDELLGALRRVERLLGLVPPARAHAARSRRGLEHQPRSRRR